jgi:hypothetical protein
MPFREEDGYLIASDKLSIWPMKKNSEEFKVDIFMHRQDDQFHLQFCSNERELALSEKKIVNLTQNYANKMAHSSFEIRSECRDCRRYQHTFSDLRLDFKMMRTKPYAELECDSFLYLRSLPFDEVKVYVLERARQKISLWAGKMKTQELEERWKTYPTKIFSNCLPMYLQMPDFPFEQMPENDLLQRLDTLLLFS